MTRNGGMLATAWKDGRMRDNPLHGVTGYNAKEDRRHDRRTISLDELLKLNKVSDPKKLQLGQNLKLPPKKS